MATPAKRYEGMSDAAIEIVERERTLRGHKRWDAVTEITRIAVPSAVSVWVVEYLDAAWINALIAAVAVLVVAAMGYRLQVNRGEKRRLRSQVANSVQSDERGEDDES